MIRPYLYHIGSVCPVHAYWSPEIFNLKAVSSPVPGPQSGYEHGEDYSWLIQVDAEEIFGISGPIWVGWNKEHNHWEFFDGFLSSTHILDHE